LSIPGCVVARHVDREVRNVDEIGVAIGSAAKNRSHAGQQLGKRERLHQIVVGAELQSLDTPWTVSRAVRNRTGVERLAARRLDNTDQPSRSGSITSGMTIVFTRHRRVQPILSAGAHIGDESMFDESVPQVSGGLWLVLDEEDLHARLDTNANGRIKAKGADVQTGS
jgi:hypothetical protein